MRKTVCCFLAVSLLATITACGNTREDAPAESAKPTGQTESSAVTEENTYMNDEIETNSTGAESGTFQEGENDMAEMGVFNFETKTVLLNSGYEMPVYGIGTYSLTGETCVESVSSALESGVRLIDTAHMYNNEESVGEAVRNSGIPREEIFVITKLYPNQFSDAEAAIDEALDKLDIGYIDARVIIRPSQRNPVKSRVEPDLVLLF